MYMENWWETTSLCETFGIDGACSLLVDDIPCNTHNFTGGMTGVSHSDETKEKIRKSSLGRDMSEAISSAVETNKKGGSLEKDGVVYHFDNTREFCRQHNLPQPGVLYRVLTGKAKSYKGFRLANI